MKGSRSRVGSAPTKRKRSAATSNGIAVDAARREDERAEVVEDEEEREDRAEVRDARQERAGAGPARADGGEGEREEERDADLRRRPPERAAGTPATTPATRRRPAAAHVRRSARVKRTRRCSTPNL